MNNLNVGNCKLIHAVLVLLALIIEHGFAAAAPSELWKINADGTGLARVVETPGYTCGSPEWSPDGKWIAYDTRRVGEALEDSTIAIVRADGADFHIIGIGAMPSWSPDGKQLVVHTYGRDANGQRSSGDKIVVMNIDGTGREIILNHWGSPRWLRSGNRILSIVDSVDNLSFYDLAAGTEHVILRRPVSMYWGLGASPNGQRFAFGGYDSGLYLATLDEQKMKADVRTLLPGGKCYFPSFAPDNKRIVFGYLPDGAKVNQLYVMDVEKNDKPQLLPGQNPTYGSWGPNWSADGKTIVFCSRKIEPKPAAEKEPPNL